MVLRRVVLRYFEGFAMGSADIVPGVSGGTVALVLGIYTTLLSVVRDGARALGLFVRGRFGDGIAQLKAVNWAFIIPLGLGILSAIALLSSVIEGLLVDYPEEMAGFFLGLVIASSIIAWRMITSVGTSEIAITAVVAVVTFVLLGFSSGPIADPSLLTYFGAGAIAICAMILPGISGSFLLLMMGMYAAVLGAVHDRDLVVLVVFALGATVGLALFSTLLGHLLDNYRNTVIAALVGLMIGSVRVLWPWPNGVGVISEEADEVVSGTGLEWPGGDQWLWPTVLGVVGCLAVLAVASVADRTAEAT